MVRSPLKVQYDQQGVLSVGVACCFAVSVFEAEHFKLKKENVHDDFLTFLSTDRSSSTPYTQLKLHISTYLLTLLIYVRRVCVVGDFSM